MGDITEEQEQIFIILNFVSLCSLVGLFGIASNIINLIVFYKQGLDSSMNITFFAMSISDLCSGMFMGWCSVCINPLFEAADLPFLPMEFSYLTAGTPRLLFSKITCFITVYATLERCLCIAFPLRVKKMLTPRRTATIMVCIYIGTFLSLCPLYYAVPVTWQFYPERNKTLLGLNFANGAGRFTEIAFLLQTYLLLVSFAAVVVFTAILVWKLTQNINWRKSANVDAAKREAMSARHRKTMTMIALIASVLIVCYTPSVWLFCANFFEPEFIVTGRYENLFISLWSFGFLFETINSSVNIFLYLKMSSKYREVFYSMCDCWAMPHLNSG